MHARRRGIIAVPVLLLAAFAAAAAVSFSIFPSARARAEETAEKGVFRLHKFEQPIGQESYAIKKEGDEMQLSVSFHFNDRGEEVPLSAFVRLSKDLTPRSMEMHGDRARNTPIDDSVLVEKDRILVRKNEKWHAFDRPEQFFGISTYAPVALQMMLVRKWQAAGRPKKMQTFPTGVLSIEDRGADDFFLKGTKVTLERFSISDLAWGRETLWLDAQNQLVALITVDGEYDHFEGVKPEYEDNLGNFVQRAAADEMAALSAISKDFRHDNSHGSLALVGANLIDGTGAPALSDSSVVIQDGKIVSVGPRGKVKLPKDAQIVDLTDKTIIPGLWDMHAHFEQVEWGPVYLAAGVTTVRDCGNEFEFITAVRDAINSGHGVGPRLLLAGIVDGSGPIALGVARVDTPEQAREWVRRYHDAGFEQIKIYSSVKKESLEVVAKVAPALSTQLRNVGPGAAGAELGEARFAVSLKTVGALHRAGIPIVVGTDQTVPGHSVHREMELYVEAGFTPVEALQSATIVSARAMRLDKEVGTIEPGKRADLVVLGANPLDNISNIRKTERVIQAGVFYDCASLWKSVDFRP